MSINAEAEELTNRIKAACKTAGITLQALAESSGIAYSTLRRKLNKPDLFNVRELSAIAAALDTHLAIGFAA